MARISGQKGDIKLGDVRFLLWAGMVAAMLWANFDRLTVPAWAADPQTAKALFSTFRSDSIRPAGRPAVRVVDGDTFWIGGDKIRIADIDTPETHPPRCAYEAELGAKATRRLAVLLDQGPFALEPIGGRDLDRYGRKLRIVTRNGRSLGDILVAEGLARTWTGRREPWCVAGRG